MLSAIPGGEVHHVAALSDGYGYDISFARSGEAAHLEVKSTTRRSRFTAYLSRNEYSVMLRDNSWVLVTVRLDDELDIIAVGSVPSEWIAANVPRDDGPFGSWASVKLEVPAEVINPGVPQLGGGLSRVPSGLVIRHSGDDLPACRKAWTTCRTHSSSRSRTSTSQTRTTCHPRSASRCSA